MRTPGNICSRIRSWARTMLASPELSTEWVLMMTMFVAGLEFEILSYLKNFLKESRRNLKILRRRDLF